MSSQLFADTPTIIIVIGTTKSTKRLPDHIKEILQNPIYLTPVLKNHRLKRDLIFIKDLVPREAVLTPNADAFHSHQSKPQQCWKLRDARVWVFGHRVGKF